MDHSEPSPRPGNSRSRSPISPQTLIIASLASAAASFAVARIWGPGTLFGAAAAPVIVALVSESLRRPVKTVAATARRTTPSPKTRARAWHPRWALALATGGCAFAIVVGVFTVPDLLAGSSITGNGAGTTFFGGSSNGGGSKTPATTTVTTGTKTTITSTSTSKAPVTKTVPATTSASTTTTSATTTSATSTPTISSSTTAAPSTTTAGTVTTATTPGSGP